MVERQPSKLNVVGSKPIIRLPYRGVAQSGSVSALGAEGRRFKSYHPDSHTIPHVHIKKGKNVKNNSTTGTKKTTTKKTTAKKTTAKTSTKRGTTAKKTNTNKKTTKKTTLLAENGHNVKVHYKGTLNDGTVFDTSHDRGTIDFQIGGGQMLPGFDSAVVGMEVGETKASTLKAVA